MEDLATHKKKLHQLCLDVVLDRIHQQKTALEAARESTNSDSKSSAGDKHETSRAMGQIEQEKLAGQLAQSNKMWALMDQLDPSQRHKMVEPGSVVLTNGVGFYLAVSVGKLEIDGQFFFAISAATPIGQQLLGKKLGDHFTFNGKELEILDLA